MTAPAFVVHTCFPDSVPRDLPILPSLSAIELGVSVLAMLTGVAAIVVATRSYRRIGDAPISEGRACFMARAGILASSLFLGGMVLHALGILMLAPCK